MKRSVAFLAFVLAAAPAVTAVRPALADTADQRFSAGMKAAERGQFEEARTAFQEAYALQPTQPTLWNLAMAEYKTGRAVDSIRHVKQYLKGTPTDPRYVQLAPQILDRLSTQTCHLEIQTVQDAEITIDGEKWPEKGPLTDTVDVTGGEHLVEAKKDDKSARERATCTAGQTVRVGVLLDEPPPPPPPVTPPPPATPPPVTPPPTTGDTGPSGGFWSTGRIIGFSVAAVGLGAGITGFAIMTSKKNGAADDAAAITNGIPNDTCRRTPAIPDCAKLRSLGDDFDRAEVLRGTFLITGGLVAAGGVVGALLAGPKRAANAPLVLPYAGAHGGGVGVSGAF